MPSISDDPLNPAIVDVDFDTEAKIADRLMGCNPRTDKPGDACPLFGEAFRDFIIPRADWDSVVERLQPDNSRLDHHQWDQDGEGTCTANAESAGFAQIWNRTYGKDWHVAPAPPSIYQFCARSGNSGSTTSCILEQGRKRGHILIDNHQNREVLTAMGLDPSHTIKAVGWNQSIRGMEETAKQFRVAEFYETTTTDEFFSAIIRGFPILYGRSGHAIKATDVVKRQGVWCAKYLNSWGPWGENGYGYDTLDYIRRTNAPYGAYAIQSLVAPDNANHMLGVPAIAT